MTNRAQFLASLAAASAAPSLTPSPSPAPRLRRGKHTFDFNEAAFTAVLNKPARHKQCFGSKNIDGGSVLMAMNNSMNAYDHFLGEGAGALQPVAVLYHGPAIALAMNSTVWNDILFPAMPKAPPDIRSDFTDARAGKGNPYLRESLLPQVVARGGSFFVCHNAIMGFAGIAAGALKEPVEKVHAAIMKGIVHGALVVPAGVMAINAAQEARFTYIAA